MRRWTSVKQEPPVGLEPTTARLRIEVVTRFPAFPSLPCLRASIHGKPPAPKTLGRRFQVRELTRVWAGDVTACWTQEGWLYLAALLDLGSRRVVGSATSATLDQELTLTAWRQAVAHRRPAVGLLHHSDRGTSYTGEAYRAAFAGVGIAVSMSRPSDCWDNAVLESFFATL